MTVGETFTHEGVEYTATSVDGTTVKGVGEVDVEMNDVVTVKKMERICIEESDISD